MLPISRPSAPLFWFGSDSMMTRFIARIVLASWMLPLLFALFFVVPATPAQAQTTQETVVVLDFAASPGLDPLLGRKAADGLAVELQRSGDFEVVPRARVEEVVAQRAGLQPPFNDTAQILLAQAVNARSIFSGRVVAVNVRNGREASVVIEARQLDAATGDFINGTQVSETSEQKLQSVANEILIDEALNKAVFSAVRQMRQTSLPQGNVLNTTTEDVELSIGSARGVARGQKYSVLRDVFNQAKRITERTKIGEVTITRVESDQSVARLTAGGQQGVLTGDRVRRIFVPGSYPVSPASFSSDGRSSSPVTSPPVTRVGGDRGGGGVGGFVQKSGRGLLGLVGLGLLVGIAGFGGGGSGQGAPDIARQPQEANPEGTYPRATFRFTSGIDGISTSIDRAQQEAVVAYLVFRGTSPAFSPDVRNLQEVIDARFVGGRTNIPFTDLQTNSGSDNFFQGSRSQIVRIASGGAGTTTTDSVTLTIIDGGFTDFNTLTQQQNSLEIRYTPQPYIIGESYYYAVGRVTAERVRQTGTTGVGGATTTTVTIQPFRSPVGGQSGRYTPLFRPEIVDTTEDTDDFTVRINTDLTAFDPLAFTGDIFDFNNIAIDYQVPPNANVATGVNQFRVEVSRTQSFDRNSTFISPNLAPPANIGPGGNVTFNLGGITIPSLNGEPYQPGQTLFVRVLARNTNDIVEVSRVSPTVSFVEEADTNTNLLTSRFLATPSARRGAGVGLGRLGAGRGAASDAYAAPRVLKPRR